MKSAVSLLRSGKWLLAILLSIAGVVAWGALRPEGPDLLKKGYSAVPADFSPERFWWRGDSEFLLYRRGDGSAFHSCPSDGTGAPKPEPKLRAAFSESQGDLDTLRTSPDGAMALWVGRDGTKTVLYEFETGVKREYQRLGHGAPLWKANSFGWYELLDSGEEYGAASDRSLDNSARPTTRAMFPAFPKDPTQINPESLTATGDEHVLVHYWNAERGQIDPVRILACGFGANPSLKGKFTVPAPHAHTFAEVRFAPESQQIVWILRYRRFLGDLASYYARGSGMAKQGITGIYVTAMGSRSSDLIGVVEGTDSAAPAQPQVSPDGERIAFLCNGAVWAVPLPEPARAR